MFILTSNPMSRYSHPMNSPSHAFPSIDHAWTDLAALALLSSLWGGSFLFMRVAAPAFGPVALVAVRLSVAAALTAPLLWRARRDAALRRAMTALLVLGLFNSALPFMLFSYAALALPAGFSAVLNATAAWWAAIVGWAVFGTTLSRRGWFGLLIGTGGVALMVGHQLFGPGLDAAASAQTMACAVIAALAATACYGASVHYARSRLGTLPAPLVAAGSMAWAGLLMALPGYGMWPEQPPPREAWWAALALGALSTALAYALYFRLLARIGPARLMTVTLLVPAVGVLLGVWLLREPLTVGIAAGAALVLFGTGLSAGPSHSTKEST